MFIVGRPDRCGSRRTRMVAVTEADPFRMRALLRRLAGPDPHPARSMAGGRGDPGHQPLGRSSGWRSCWFRRNAHAAEEVGQVLRRVTAALLVAWVFAACGGSDGAAPDDDATHYAGSAVSFDVGRVGIRR